MNKDINHDFFIRATFSFLIFLFLYNVSFLSMSALTTTRIAIVFFIGLLLLSHNALNTMVRALKKDRIYFLLFTPFIVWNFIHFRFGYGDPTQFARSVYFFIYVLICAPLVAALIKTKERFIFAVFIAGLIQAFFVYVSFVVPEYKDWLATVVQETGNVPLRSKVRSAGFSNGASSALSLVISLSVFSGMLIFKETKHALNRVLVFFGVIFIFASTIFVGRVGLIMSAYFITIILLLSFSNKKNILVLVAVVGGVAILGPIAYEYLSQNSKFEERVLGWAFSFLTDDDVTADRLVDMNIPPLTINNFFFGNSNVKLSNGLNASGSDIGYIQTYFASGLLMTLYFYILFALYMLKQLLKSSSQLIGLTILLPIFLLEIKEPFTFKYMYPFFALTFLYLSQSNFINKTYKLSA